MMICFTLMKQEVIEFLGYISTEQGLSPKTTDAYRYDLAKFTQFVDRELRKNWTWDEVDQNLIKAYMQFLAQTGYRKGNSGVSRGRKLATLKSFFKYLYGEGKIKYNPASQVKMPKVQKKESSYLTEPEYKHLLRTVNQTATKYFKARDMAIITTLLGMGLRVSELVDLNIANVNFDDSTVRVIRKGNHERILPANEEVIRAINRYLRERKDTTASLPLFLSKRKRRIGAVSVWYLVKKYLKQAQIEKDKLSPQTMRHTFASILLKKGENILTIKELLSHRSLRTTQERYLHINNEDLKSAVQKIDLSID